MVREWTQPAGHVSLVAFHDLFVVLRTLFSSTEVSA